MGIGISQVEAAAAEASKQIIIGSILIKTSVHGIEPTIINNFILFSRVEI